VGSTHRLWIEQPRAPRTYRFAAEANSLEDVDTSSDAARYWNERAGHRASLVGGKE
jgi:hypothetical protein